MTRKLLEITIVTRKTDQRHHKETIEDYHSNQENTQHHKETTGDSSTLSLSEIIMRERIFRCSLLLLNANNESESLTLRSTNPSGSNVTFVFHRLPMK